MTKVGLAGLGYWGPNLARNFDELAELAWLCDLSDEQRARFASGKIAHMHLSWLDPHKMRRLTVVGRDKMAVFDDMELDRKLTIYDKGPVERAETYGEWMTRTGDIHSPKIANDEPLRLEMQHFLRLVRNGTDGTEAHDGLAVVRVLERLTESLRGH